MHLKFRINLDEIDLDQLIAAQKKDLEAIRDMMVACLVDESGNYVDGEIARKVIGGIKLSQLNDAIETFTKEIIDTAINPTSDGS